MSDSVLTVIILSANSALSSILAAVLAADSRLRVRQFDNEIGLRAYMRLAPVDILVCDFDAVGDTPPIELVQSLRHDDALHSRDFQILVLTRLITLAMGEQIIACGIDEVIVKPMSPRHLLERVQVHMASLTRMGPLSQTYRGIERRTRNAPRLQSVAPRRGDNVVQLFPLRHQSTSEPA